MKEDTKTLDEVVVVGYGTQKKVNLTGVVSSVGAGRIERTCEYRCIGISTRTGSGSNYYITSGIYSIN